jgi:iron(III) transport system substrate-binding protein
MPICPRSAFAAILALGGLLALQDSASALTNQEIAKLTGPDRQKILEEGAKKEGKVVIYSSLIVNQLLRPWQEAFEKKYPGIKFEYWRADTGPILQKMTTERQAKNQQFDAMEYSGTAIVTAIKAGAAESFTSPVLQSDFDPDTYDTQNGFWAGTRTSYFGTAYNTKLVPQAPTSFEALLDPKWKGKMAWETSDTGRVQFITNVLLTMGEKDGEEYLKKLSAQNVIPSTASARALVDRVGQGEYPIALHIYAHHPLISKQEGAPLDTALMEPIDSGLAGIQLAKDAPHPHAAMLMIDFILGREAQTITRDADYFPVNAKVEPKESMKSIVPRVIGKKERVFRPETLFANRERSHEMVKKYFDR